MKLTAMVVVAQIAVPTLASANSVSLQIEARADDYDVPPAAADSRLYEPNLTSSGAFSTGLAINPLLGNGARIDATVLRSPAPYLSLSGQANGANNRAGSGTLAAYVAGYGYGSLSMRYQVTVVGPGTAYVPLLIDGVSQGDIVASAGSGSGQIYAALGLRNLITSAAYSVGGNAYSTSSFRNPDGTLNYNASFTNNSTRAGDWSFRTSFQYAASVRGGSSFDIALDASMSIYDTTGAGTTADVRVDPLITIDPVWLISHPGYSVQTEAGFGNALPVPEPKSWALLLAGLGIVGAARRCRDARSA